jgi:alpha-beta hydrolase superfamily lysophospholipase
VKEQARDLPVYLLGHSHGGLISARYLLDKPDAVRGIILSSPFFRLKLQVPALKLMAGKLIARVLPGLPMKNELKVELLTRDVAIQNATRADPLYQLIATPGWFVACSGAQETVMRRATEFVTPFFMLFGGADGIADPTAGREFFDAATSKDKQHKLYDGLVHETFHEPERDLVFKDVVGWLDERVRGAARAAAAR